VRALLVAHRSLQRLPAAIGRRRRSQAGDDDPADPRAGAVEQHASASPDQGGSGARVRREPPCGRYQVAGEEAFGDGASGQSGSGLRD
jgi:hypothetical protein